MRKSFLHAPPKIPPHSTRAMNPTLWGNEADIPHIKCSARIMVTGKSQTLRVMPFLLCASTDIHSLMGALLLLLLQQRKQPRLREMRQFTQSLADTRQRHEGSCYQAALPFWAGHSLVSRSVLPCRADGLRWPWPELLVTSSPRTSVTF